MREQSKLAKKEAKIFTIGLAGKSAREFFTLLKEAKVKSVVDVRLNNTSQLAGFAKSKDIEYFLQEICQIGYSHYPEMAPTKEIRDAYKKKKIDWQEYERRFRELIRARNIENIATREQVNNSCFLCSEEKAEKCHRRLVAEYIKECFGDMEIQHL